MKDNNKRVDCNKVYINVTNVVQYVFKVNIKYTSMSSFDLDVVPSFLFEFI